MGVSGNHAASSFMTILLVVGFHRLDLIFSLTSCVLPFCERGWR